MPDRPIPPDYDTNELEGIGACSPIHSLRVGEETRSVLSVLPSSESLQPQPRIGSVH